LLHRLINFLFSNAYLIQKLVNFTIFLQTYYIFYKVIQFDLNYIQNL